eukprot:TRINITY_DN5241_c0_g2_i10.p1 TRINITY_DN5241_c0_g2~~TRINITY_DN5241_c0_g2_i10.p1  ORF type:complete len:569 (+),score=143.96 TRINITY_DN5241_c0_g2_i10:72-1709(+)
MGYETKPFTNEQMTDPSAGEDEMSEDFGNISAKDSVYSTGSGYQKYLDNGEKVVFDLRKLWAFTGPGFLMSIAYLDPGNLEADLQAGASGKYQLLWILFWATVMGLVLQNLASKLGLVSGKHLAQHCTKYPKYVKYTLWIMTEIALICADCQEVVGSAIAIRLLSGKRIPIWAGCLITAADCFAFMLLDKRGMRKLEALFGVFITTMVVTFGFQYFAKLPPQGDLFEGWARPHISSNDNFQIAVGLIGAVIMPHNLFLHSALVLSRKVNRKFDTEPEMAKYRVTEAIYYNHMESAIALLVSFVINLFVVGVFAHLSYYDADGLPVCSYDGKCVVPSDNTDGTNCTQIGLLTAGDCLKDVYNESWWLYIWALGVLAAGQASTITGTYAGQFIMEGFLNLKVKPALRTLFSRCFSLIPAMVVAIETPGDPDGMDNLNQWLNIVQSIQLPFAMLPVLYFATDVKSCREFTTKGWVSWVVWVIALIVLVSNVYAIVLTASQLPDYIPVWIAFGLFNLFYVCLVGYLCLICARVLRLPEPNEEGVLLVNR